MKKLIIAMLIALVLFPFTSFYANSENLLRYPSIPEIPQIKSISIHGTLSGGTMTDVKIEPFDKIYTHRFVRIWWENYSNTPINLKFGRGDNCKKFSSLVKVQFWRLNKECYITQEPIPQKGALQMWFDDSGTYEFEIEFVGTKSTKKGELIVF